MLSLEDTRVPHCLRQPIDPYLSRSEMVTRKEFWAHVCPGPPDCCWEWLSGLDRAGYGQLRGKTKTLKAHRVAYEKSVGPIPRGMVIRHSCHNPKCCNPSHLSVGTHADNHRDMVQANRHFVPESPKGEDHPCSKLTSELVKELRSREGVGLTELSERYNVSKQTIWKIRTRRAWKHV